MQGTLPFGLLGLALVGWSCAEERAPAAPQTPSVQPQPPSYPDSAKVSVHEQFLEDLALERHPSDGGGTLRLVLEEGEDGSVQAGGYGRWIFEYIAGPLGIAEGGSLLMLVPPFWGWSTPQVQRPDRPGFSTVSTRAPGIRLLPSTVDRNLLLVEIAGRALAAGERVQLVYGASAALARADDYAEANSTFTFKVDGNGDGLSGLVSDQPSIRIHPGPPARMTATLTSSATPHAPIRLNLALMDAVANALGSVQGTLSFESDPTGLELPKEVVLPGPSDPAGAPGSFVHLELKAPEPGIYRVRVHFRGDDFEAQIITNPLRVAAGATAIYWGDLHGHSGYSDGTGTPGDYYAYARDVSALDFAVLTDHDHFGVRFLDATPEIWEEIQAQTRRFDEPGRFLALLGYEWTSWLYGHRHVLYFDGTGEVHSSVGAQTTTPAELWAALEGQNAMTFAHHSAGGPVATDWSFRPDPWIEPLTEIMSVHGSSEASDSPSRIYSPREGNFVRNQLDEGLQFGFIGSGDSHDGHPGHAHLSPSAGYRRTRPDPRVRRAEERMGKGGLAAVRARALTSEDLLAAFRARATYATSGPRIWLETTLQGLPMGMGVKATDSATLSVEFAGTSRVEYVEIIQRHKRVERVLFGQTMDARFEHPLGPLASGDYVYVRLLQNDGALCWSSPYYVD